MVYRNNPQGAPDEPVPIRAQSAGQRHPHRPPGPGRRKTGVLHIGDQNYYNIRASVEASGVLEGAPYTVDWKHFQAAALWLKR